MQAELMNHKIITANISVRGVLFLITLLSTALFTVLYCRQDKAKRITEQKLVIALSVSTLLFNDPLYSYAVVQDAISWYDLDDIGWYSTWP